MSTSASTPEPSSTWIPTDFNDDESSLRWFAYDSTANPIISSGGPCEFDCTLEIEKGTFDFGKWTRPDFKEAPRIKTMTREFSKIESELLDILNKIDANKRDKRKLEELNTRLEALAKENDSLIKEMQALGFTIVPMTPLPAGPPIKPERRD